MTLEMRSRRVRLFTNGRNQAVRIPREFELPGEEAIMHKDSEGRIVLEPSPRKDLLAVLASLRPLPEEESMPEIEKLTAAPVNL